jgi:hypothetical protein
MNSGGSTEYLFKILNWIGMSNILSKEFDLLDEALEYLSNLDYGEIHSSDFGNFTFYDDDISEGEDNLYFTSETSTSFFKYTIQKHAQKYILKIYATYKNKMVSGAITGDLDMFIDNFENNAKMREFTLHLSIQYNNWNITEYLLENFTITANPIWYAIRWNNSNILSRLLELNYQLPANWLPYCLYNDSLEIVQYLHSINPDIFKFSKDNWFKKEISKTTKTAEYMRKNLID